MRRLTVLVIQAAVRQSVRASTTTKAFRPFLRSGAGKTTLAKRLHQASMDHKLPAIILGSGLLSFWIYIQAPLDVCICRDPKGSAAALKPARGTDFWVFPLTCHGYKSRITSWIPLYKTWKAVPTRFWHWCGSA